MLLSGRAWPPYAIPTDFKKLAGRVSTIASTPSTDVAVDRDGNMYILDPEGNTLRKIDPNTKIATTLHETPSIPVGLAIDLNANVLYIACYASHCIMKYNLKKRSLSLFAGVANENGDENGDSLKSKFNTPGAVAVGPNGDVYVSDSGNSKIKRISGGTVSTMAIMDEDSPPWRICVAADSTVYFAAGHAIYKLVTHADTPTIFAGSSIEEGNQDGVAENARFMIPTGICIDSKGNLYVSDNGSDRIRVIDTKGNVSTLAGSTTGHLDGVTTSAQFSSPQGLSVANGKVYVADTGNSKVRLIE